MDYQKGKGFENFIRSRLKVRIEFLENYLRIFPELMDQEDLLEIVSKGSNLWKLNFAALYLLELEINEAETSIQNQLKNK